MSRRTVCVDFDGVLHSYTSPWKGADIILDPPVPGAAEWLRSMLEAGFDVAILSTRTASPSGRLAITQWLDRRCKIDIVAINREEGAKIFLTETKPPALIYIDDRGYRFEGDNWPTARYIEMASTPWNKR